MDAEESWDENEHFRVPCDRKEAVQLLHGRPKGTYLVRADSVDAISKDPFKAVLSLVIDDGKYQHVRITRKLNSEREFCYSFDGTDGSEVQGECQSVIDLIETNHAVVLDRKTQISYDKPLSFQLRIVGGYIELPASDPEWLYSPEDQERDLNTPAHPWAEPSHPNHHFYRYFDEPWFTPTSPKDACEKALASDGSNNELGAQHGDYLFRIKSDDSGICLMVLDQDRIFTFNVLYDREKEEYTLGSTSTDLCEIVSRLSKPRDEGGTPLASRTNRMMLILNRSRVDEAEMNSNYLDSCAAYIEPKVDYTRIFVSFYARESSAIFSMLVACIEAKGSHKVFECTKDLKHTSKDGMRSAVRESCLLLVVLSPGFFDSPYCEAELDEAVQKSVPIVGVYDGDEYTLNAALKLKEADGMVSTDLRKHLFKNNIIRIKDTQNQANATKSFFEAIDSYALKNIDEHE